MSERSALHHEMGRFDETESTQVFARATAVRPPEDAGEVDGMDASLVRDVVAFHLSAGVRRSMR